MGGVYGGFGRLSGVPDDHAFEVRGQSGTQTDTSEKVA
jgi:hypothetical protein